MWEDGHSIKDIMKAQGIPDFQAPPPPPTLIDTFHTVDKLPSSNSLEPAPDDFQTPLPLSRNGGRLCERPFFTTSLTTLCSTENLETLYWSSRLRFSTLA